MSDKVVLGIDVGASGIKGALVDVKKGELITPRFRVETPRPANPKNMARAFGEVVKHFDYQGAIGCGFPAVVRKGVAYTAANIDDAWIGKNVAKVFGKASDCQVYVQNDADLAGVAEMQFGAGRGKDGTVILITVGSGLGSALFLNGELVPNTEFGHFYLKGQKKVVEQYAADSVRKREELDFKEWGGRFNKFLKHLEKLFSPDLFIVGGGGSKRLPEFESELTVDTKVVAAQMRNEAGIIGAAYLAFRKHKNEAVSV